MDDPSVGGGGGVPLRQFPAHSLSSPCSPIALTWDPARSEPAGRVCTCKPGEVAKYLSSVSGPLLDRIDIQVELPAVTYEQMHEKKEASEGSAEVRARVNRARKFARERFRAAGETGIFSNADLSGAEIAKHCQMSEDASRLLEEAFTRLSLSARGHDRILKVARTVADLDGSPLIEKRHIAEAISYRSLDRKYWSR